jgi:hypothetical protein
MRREIGPWRAHFKAASAFVCGELLVAFANEIDGSVEAFAVNDDLDQVALAHLSDRTTSKRLRRDMTKTGAGGDTAETSVC